jgi:hypothetical protein
VLGAVDRKEVDDEEGFIVDVDVMLSSSHRRSSSFGLRDSAIRVVTFGTFKFKFRHFRNWAFGLGSFLEQNLELYVKEPQLI